MELEPRPEASSGMSHLELGFLLFVTQSIPKIHMKCFTLNIIKIEYQVGKGVTGFKERKTSPHQQAKMEFISSRTRTVSE